MGLCHTVTIRAGVQGDEAAKVAQATEADLPAGRVLRDEVVTQDVEVQVGHRNGAAGQAVTLAVEAAPAIRVVVALADRNVAKVPARVVTSVAVTIAQKIRKFTMVHRFPTM